jgi:XTP/dITP diphosphohydrolase
LKLYLASANAGKLREFREAAGTHGIRVEQLPDIQLLRPCNEDGLTFEANARKKALHYSALVEGRVFADDSGLAVESLGGAPGVHSARFAGPDASDEENNQKLLAELAKVSAESAPFQPRAHYVCVIALAERGRILTTVEGRAEGLILNAPRGSGGFGYDPFFFYPPLGKTFAQLTPQEKFAVSHRGEAFRKLLDYLSGRG